MNCPYCDHPALDLTLLQKSTPKYRIEKGAYNEGGNLFYNAVLPDGAKIGEVILTKDGKAALGLYVSPEYRRIGVATALYDFIEQDLGYPLAAAPERSTDEQKEFRRVYEERKRK